MWVVSIQYKFQYPHYLPSYPSKITILNLKHDSNNIKTHDFPMKSSCFAKYPEISLNHLKSPKTRPHETHENAHIFTSPCSSQGWRVSSPSSSGLPERWAPWPLDAGGEHRLHPGGGRWLARKTTGFWGGRDPAAPVDRSGGLHIPWFCWGLSHDF